MKPISKDPNITIEQLMGELTDPQYLEQALDTPGEQEATSHADDVLNHLSQKVMRVMRKATKKAETKPELKDKLSQLEASWGVAPDKLHQHLHQLGPKDAAVFLIKHSSLLDQLAQVRHIAGSDQMPIIYQGKDEFLGREQTYGIHEKPADYLDSFNDFIINNINKSAALSVVVNRAKDLTREQLKEVKLLLDDAGFSATHLQTA